MSLAGNVINHGGQEIGPTGGRPCRRNDTHNSCPRKLTLLLLEPVNGLEADVWNRGVADKPKPHCLIRRPDFWREICAAISGRDGRVSVATVADFNLVVVAILSCLLNPKLITKLEHNVVADGSFRATSR